MLLLTGICSRLHDATGAYVQWRARAIGEKGTAAEAKLEKAGPFEGMTVRRAMAVVLGVLQETLEDDFSIDRLEMACVDMRTCATGGDGGSGSTGGAERAMSSVAVEHSSSNSKRDGAGTGAVGVGSYGGGDGLSTSGEEPEGDAGTGNSVRGSGIPNSVRRGVLEVGGSRNVGHGSPSSGAGFSFAADYFVPRYGYFRRVSKSEMEELLADSTSGGDSKAAEAIEAAQPNDDR